MSVGPHEDLNGWPAAELEREPVTLPELSEHAGYPELARAYASVTVTWHRLWPKVVEALYWLRGAWIGTRSELLSLRRELGDRHQELLAEVRKRPPSMRPKAPSFSSFSPELTSGGGIRLEGPAWEALQRTVAEHQEALEEAQREKLEAQAREKGATDALATVASKGKSRRELVLFILAVLSPLASLAAWLWKAHG